MALTRDFKLAGSVESLKAQLDKDDSARRTLNERVKTLNTTVTGFETRITALAVATCIHNRFGLQSS